MYTATVTPPTQLVIRSPAAPVSRFGANTGAVDVTVSGGTPGYTYQWTPAGPVTQDLTNVAAGTYTVTVRDANNCSATATATVTQPTQLVATATATPVSCVVDNNGAVDLTATGGTGAHTYLWSNNATTQDLNNVVAGTYTVTVRDQNNCTTTATAVVTQPTDLALGTTTTPAACNGGATGGVDLTVNGGTPGYVYTWSNGATTQDLTNVAAGTYTVTVRDQNNCTKTATATVSQPSSIVLTETHVNVSCAEGADGSINLTVNGGTPAYTYLWSNTATTQDVTGLSANTYTVTVRDANNCSATLSVVITQPDPLTVTSQVTPATCSGSNNSSIDLTPGGGTPGYTYLWSNNATTQDLTNIPAGTYTVTVRDANNCMAIRTIIVTEPAPLAANATATPVSCFGGTNGSVDLTVSGGTPAYTYAWSNNATTQDLANVPAGTYTVTIFDANNCSTTTSATVTQPTRIALSSTVTPVACNGAANGAINLTVSGGTPAYTFNWSNGATTEDLTNLAAGTYTATVTDANNCVSTTTATVNQPTALVLGTTPTQVGCNGAQTGAIDLAVSGGTPAYTYVWSNAATTQDLTDLAAGTYTVTVRDANNCSATTTAIITEPTPLVVNAIPTPVSCFGGTNGAVNLTAGGGTPGYTYTWSNGATTQNLSGIVAGTYTVTVRDANNCSATTSAVVTQPTALALSTVVTNAACNGALTGSIDLTVSGGTVAYTYLWSNGATAQDVAGLAAGTYTVTVTDANACTATATATVTQPTALAVTQTVVDVTCNGGNNGSIDLNVSGGSQPYSYTWSNGATTQDLINLTANTYTVTVQDANGCSVVRTIQVAQPVPMTATASASPVSCNGGNDGTITINVTADAVTPFSFMWNNGSGSMTGGNILNNPFVLTGLAAGNYALTITNGNGCTAVTSATVNQPPALVATPTVTNVACFGGNNGAVNLSVTGGTPGYTYVWSTGATTSGINGLTAGTYTVTVRDANNCSTTATATVTQPTALNLSVTTNPANCNGSATGRVDLTVSGGSVPYTYAWSNGANTQDLNVVVAGTYTVTVTDSHNCTATTSATVTQPAPIALTATTTPVSCNGGANGAVDLTPSGGSGGYGYLWSNTATTQDLVNVPAGTYTVTVSSPAGSACTATTTVVVAQPAPLTANATATPVTCFGGTNGAVNLTVSGGTTNYTYLWSTGAVTQNLANVAAGTYTATVTRNNNCTAKASDTVV